MISGREGGLAWVKSAWTVVGGGSDSRSRDLWIIEEAYATSEDSQDQLNETGTAPHETVRCVARN